MRSQILCIYYSHLINWTCSKLHNIFLILRLNHPLQNIKFYLIWTFWQSKNISKSINSIRLMFSITINTGCTCIQISFHIKYILSMLFIKRCCSLFYCIYLHMHKRAYAYVNILFIHSRFLSKQPLFKCFHRSPQNFFSLKNFMAECIKERASIWYDLLKGCLICLA